MFTHGKPLQHTVYVCSRAHCSHGKSLQRLWQLLHYADKRIVCTMEAYIERDNIQVELIQFLKIISTLFTFTFAKWGISRPTRYLHMESLSNICLFPCTLFAWNVVTTRACSISANSTLMCYSSLVFWRSRSSREWTHWLIYTNYNYLLCFTIITWYVCIFSCGAIP